MAENPSEFKESQETLENKSTFDSPHIIAGILSNILAKAGIDKKISEIDLGENFPYTKEQLEKLEKELPNIENLETISDKGRVDRINKFLSDRGFSIQLSPVFNENSIVVAATKKIEGDWIHPGKETQVTLESGEIVSGAKLKNVEIFEGESFTGNRVVKIDAEGGKSLYISKFSGKLKDGELYSRISEFMKEKGESTEGNVTFPNIDLTIKEDIECLLGKKIPGAGIIGQAKIETILQMDKSGVSSKTGAAAEMMRGSGSGLPVPEVIINGDFIVWFENSNEVIESPYYITKEDIKSSHLKKEYSKKQEEIQLEEFLNEYLPKLKNLNFTIGDKEETDILENKTLFNYLVKFFNKKENGVFLINDDIIGELKIKIAEYIKSKLNKKETTIIINSPKKDLKIGPTKNGKLEIYHYNGETIQEKYTLDPISGLEKI